jgi:hypothetical protein
VNPDELDLGKLLIRGFGAVRATGPASRTALEYSNVIDRERLREIPLSRWIL